MKALLRDWRWILGVSVLLLIPTYGFTAPLSIATGAHVIATLAYIVLLLLFGDGFVIEGAVAVMIMAILIALAVAFFTNPDPKAAWKAEPGHRANFLQCHASCGAGTPPLPVMDHG